MAVFVASEHIISSLGKNTKEVMTSIENGFSGLQKFENPSFSKTAVISSIIDENELTNFELTCTKLEKIILYSILQAIDSTSINIQDKSVLLVLSTTKGNIHLLDEKIDIEVPRERMFLAKLATFFKEQLKLVHQPVVISNACISGVLAINYAKDLIDVGLYEHVIVTGADIVSEFVISGFQTFQAISEEICRPFDKNRNGISLGEACGTIVLTNDKNKVTSLPIIEVKDGASSNDANHISGPSRTGEGLFLAVKKTLKENTKLDFISAHGTGTLYNDEMEAIAFSRMGLENIPVNSFKGYWGHTLGAAGIIESIATIHSMQHNKLYKSFGFQEMGVSHPIQIIKENQSKELTRCMKTASGFGGCNAVVLFEKHV